MSIINSILENKNIKIKILDDLIAKSQKNTILILLRIIKNY